MRDVVWAKCSAVSCAQSFFWHIAECCCAQEQWESVTGLFIPALASLCFLAALTCLWFLVLDFSPLYSSLHYISTTHPSNPPCRYEQVEVLFRWPLPYQPVRDQPLCCQVMIMLCIGELVSHFGHPATLYKVQLYFRCVNLAMLTFIGRHALFYNTEFTIRGLREKLLCWYQSFGKKCAASIFRLEDGCSVCFKNSLF